MAPGLQHGAGIQHKVQVGMCEQRKFKSVCASTQFDNDKSLSFLPEETLDPWLPIERLLKTLIRLRGSESSMCAHANL